MKPITSTSTVSRRQFSPEINNYKTGQKTPQIESGDNSQRFSDYLEMGAHRTVDWAAVYQQIERYGDYE